MNILTHNHANKLEFSGLGHRLWKPCFNCEKIKSSIVK